MSADAEAAAAERLGLDRGSATETLRALLKRTSAGAEAGELLEELLASGGLGALGELSLSLSSLLHGDAIFGGAEGDEWDEEEEEEEEGEAGEGGFRFALPHLHREAPHRQLLDARRSAYAPSPALLSDEPGGAGREEEYAESSDPARAALRGAFLHSLLVDSLAEEEVAGVGRPSDGVVEAAAPSSRV